MDPVVPAPAPTEAPETMPAADAAVAADNYQEFEAAELAKAAGKPLAPVAAVPSPERTLSKRQQEANERTQKAVDAATADLQRQLAEAKAAVAPKPVARTEPAPAPVVAAPSKAERFQSFQDYVVKNPEATLEDYLEARDEHRDQARERSVAQQTEAQRMAEHEGTRTERARTALKDRTTTDPAFLTKVNPRILEFKSIADSQAAGVPVTPGSLVLEEMLGSEHFLSYVDYFTEHPDALATLEAVPSHLATLPPRQRAQEHGRWIVRQMGKLETTLTPAATAAADEPPPPPKLKTVSSAPPPPTEIGRRATTPADPIAAAVKSGDYAAFEQAEFAARRAART